MASSPVDGIDQVLCLSRRDLDSLGLEMIEIVDLLEEMFRQRASTEMINPPKIFEHRSDARFYSSMVAFAPAMGFASCKWQSGDADNPGRGLPMIQGLLLLTEDRTGQPVAMMDAKWITGERTAAASALVARHQAKSDARTLAIIGAGFQARKHLQAMVQAVPGLTACCVYDIAPERAHQFVAEMSPRFDVEIAVAGSAEACVRSGDIVVSGAPIVEHPEPFIQSSWVQPGCLGISIDYDASWSAAAAGRMDRVLCDDRAQLEDERRKGHFAGVPSIDAELSEMLHGGTGLRAHDGERILVFNLGIALEDLAVASVLYRRAVERSVGTPVAMG